MYGPWTIGWWKISAPMKSTATDMLVATGWLKASLTKTAWLIPNLEERRLTEEAKAVGRGSEIIFDPEVFARGAQDSEAWENYEDAFFELLAGYYLPDSSIPGRQSTIPHYAA